MNPVLQSHRPGGNDRRRLPVECCLVARQFLPVHKLNKAVDLVLVMTSRKIAAFFLKRLEPRGLCRQEKLAGLELGCGGFRADLLSEIGNDLHNLSSVAFSIEKIIKQSVAIGS